MTTDAPQASAADSSQPTGFGSGTFAALVPSSRVLWAKSGIPTGHSLLCHMLDVAAVAEAIMGRESPRSRRWIADTFGLPEDTAARWIAAAVGLHDFGKAIPGFQNKWDAGEAADEGMGLPFAPRTLSVTRHDLATTALLRPELKARFPGADWIGGVTQAQGAHHGYVPTARALQDAKPRFEGQPWLDARRALLDAYVSTVGFEALPQPKAELRLPAVAWLAGLTSVADWIGSNERWFALGERCETIAEQYADAKQRAAAALDAIGWPAHRALLTREASSDELVAAILGKAGGTRARSLQRLGDELLRSAKGPTLMIVEAPMGEGKTELAFLAHLRLQAANGHRGLYVALPTQATGNAMFRRALTFLRSFATEETLDIQLAHGGAALNEDVHHLRGIDASSGASVSSSAWFSQRKRPLLSPYGAGTIDQALFATLNVKHHFVRLWGLTNRVVVLDEIHAYDTYTSGLIAALLEWLKHMGSSVVLMSATLPTMQRARLLRAWGASDVPEASYPRISVTTSKGTRVTSVDCRALEPVEVVAIGDEIGDLVDAALAAVEGGGCGAVIVNTVTRAQALYRELKARLGADVELSLFHARYPADERNEREMRVLDRFGAGATATRPSRALLIATQVVEQSLDLDFDFMLTDLAPIDLLLQRTGRMHRHERTRPEAHARARLTVAGLRQDRLPDLKTTAWGYVYDGYVLYRTWALVGREPLWRLPGDIDRLVQLVYGNTTLPEDLDDEVRNKIEVGAYGDALALEQMQRQLALNATIDAGADPAEAYSGKIPGDEDGGAWALPAVTRLGDEGVTVIPVFESSGGWRLRATDVPFDPKSCPDDVLARRIYARQVKLARKDVVRSLKDVASPPCFDLHPLLKHFKALVLRDGVAELGKLRVSLDAELGVTYESTRSQESEGA